MAFTFRLVLRPLFFLIVLWHGGLLAAQAGAEIWVSIGPSGGAIRALALAPSDHKVVYVGTDGGIFKSTNGGGSWSRVYAGPADRNINQLAIDPSDTRIIYAGAEGKGMFRSLNGGQTWTDISAGLTTLSITALAIELSKTGRVYAGTSGAGIFRLQPKPVDDSPPEDNADGSRRGAAGKAGKGGSTGNKARPSRLRPKQVAVTSVESSGGAVQLYDGEILVVRYKGKYAAIQSVRQEGTFIRYVWWYQPDGSGAFTNRNVGTGNGVAQELNPGPTPSLLVGPLKVEWSRGGNGKGWVYFWHVDYPEISYELALTNTTDIRKVDVSKLTFAHYKWGRR